MKPDLSAERHTRSGQVERGEAGMGFGVTK